MLSAESCCADVPLDDEMSCNGNTVDSRCNQKLQANEVSFLSKFVHHTKLDQCNGVALFIEKLMQLPLQSGLVLLTSF